MSKPISKQALYSMISSHASEVVQRAIELTNSKNENVALGACKLLLNKVAPDLRTLKVGELQGIERKRNNPFQRVIDEQMKSMGGGAYEELT